MRMHIMAALTALLLASGAAAQTAQELLDKAMTRHLAQTSFSGTSSTREIYVTLIRAEDQEPGDSRYAISSQQYRHVEARFHPPDDWAVKIDRQTIVESSAHGRSSLSREVATKVNGATQLGQDNNQDGNVRLKDTPPQQLNAQLQTMIAGDTSYHNASGDLVFRYLLPSSRGLSNISWGLLSPEIRREESGTDGSKIYCISAKSLGGRPVLIWINGADFKVLRVVQLQGEGIHPSNREGGYVSLALRFVEAVYTYEPARESADTGFTTFPQPPIDFSLPVNQERFVGMTDLIRLWTDEINMSDPLQRQARQTAKQNAAKAPEPKAGQFLSAAQMNGIVIVEGDKGRASGFMTRIKNVDFVVTNLHVIGANKTITLKTMSGATLPFTAIYGALGRDIAILRVAKTEGSLSLAEDVMGATRIGQTVVVVGNNAGGGVANETTGKVKGVGPDRVEIDAAFQSGNSGSPIVSSETGKVIGIATYIQTQSADMADWARATSNRMLSADPRWFGFRLDGPVQWQAIKLENWQTQGKRINDLKTTSDALASVLSARFEQVNEQPRLLALIKDFKNRIARLGNNTAGYSDEVNDFVRKLRAFAEDDMKDVVASNFYDYYQTCLYWGDNVQAQLSYREAIVRALKDIEANPLSFTAKLRAADNERAAPTGLAK